MTEGYIRTMGRIASKTSLRSREKDKTAGVDATQRKKEMTRYPPHPPLVTTGLTGAGMGVFGVPSQI